jgi:hypothetical protein
MTLLYGHGNFYDRRDLEMRLSVTCSQHACAHILPSPFSSDVRLRPGVLRFSTLPLSLNLIIQDRISLPAVGFLPHAKRKLTYTEHNVTYYRRQSQCPLQLKDNRACAWSMGKTMYACVCETHLLHPSSRKNYEVSKLDPSYSMIWYLYISTPKHLKFGIW